MNGRPPRPRRALSDAGAAPAVRPQPADPPPDGIPDLAEITPPRRAPGAPDPCEQHEPDGGEQDVRAPHGPERRDGAVLRQRLAGDQPHVVQPEDGKAHPD